ncbi:MAG: class I SAM-dependent methyltransferase [Vicinamibacterales bacterium]|nr:class I SAM-dependent methyltransferase [Vicinamibacterales bacterium]
MQPPLRLYTDLAGWWPLLSPPSEYEEEAGVYAQALIDACDGEPRTLLELGSGGGNNASFLKRRFQCTLVDPAPGMLAHSRVLNPECEHHEGDMRTVRLGREFDLVFVHDAVCYMTTLEDLRQAVATVWVHCRPGGAALFAPDYVRETFEPATDHGGADDGVRGLRFLEWVWDPNPDDTSYTVDYTYMLREADGMVSVHHDRHREGLFPIADWLRVLTEAGFEASTVRFVHSEVDRPLDLFVGRRPRA